MSAVRRVIFRSPLLVLACGVLACGNPTVRDAPSDVGDDAADQGGQTGNTGATTGQTTGTSGGGDATTTGQDPGGGTGDDGITDGGDTGPKKGEFGWPCSFNDECDDGFCVPKDLKSGLSVCTQFCVDVCPDGWGCKASASGADIVFICVPELDVLCLECSTDSDCGFGGDLCLAIEGGHCGSGCNSAADCPDGFACVDVTGTDDAVVAKQCVPIHGSCNCEPLVDFQTDEANCGECGTVCAYDNAVAVCKDGECWMATCITGWFDLNQSDEDGCEYPCTPEKGVVDVPDPAYQDSNCDGIDGDIARAVFVAPDGLDEGNSAGTMALPFKTVKKAVSFAAQDPDKDQVLVSKGTYIQQLVVVAGVSLFGGYDRSANWQRDIETSETILRWEAVTNGVVRTVVAAEIQVPTTIEGFTIESAANPVTSGSSIAVHITKDSSGLLIQHNRIVAGNGGQGLDGMSGQPGQGGDTGAAGTEGIDESCKPEKTLVGGLGGSNACPTGAADGGKGGASGWGGSDDCNFLETIGCVFSGCKGKTNSTAGANGAPAGLGGQGGAAGPVEEPGQNGAAGLEGPPGIDGPGGGGIGSIGLDLLWHPTTGGNGDVGSHGGGAGGGGGGGGSDNGAVGDSASHGGSGGGGGAGGCGGTGATGGTGGGASMAVLIVGASPQLVNNFIVYRNGGNGGNGGFGGTGGPGGPGAPGGAGWDTSKPGGTGGQGGKGGRGGHGGGGAGGPSVGVMIENDANPSCAGNTFSQEGTGGLGGVGGDGSADIANGNPGLSTEVVGLTLDCQPD